MFRRLVVYGSAAILLSLLAPAASAQGLSASDRDKAVSYLQKTQVAMTAATQGLSNEQLTFRQAEGRWTIAEIVEHVSIVEKRVLAIVQEMAAAVPNKQHEAEEIRKAKDEAVIRAFKDRSRRLQAPEVLRPTGITPSEALQLFASTRAATLRYAQTTNADLRVHIQDTPLVKQMDGVQFMLFFGAHCERHLEQIAEVKADAKFPSAGKSEAPELAPLMKQEEEIALARSAGLPEWSENAAVYVLERGGYRKAVAGVNGFSCLVLRNAQGLISPICFDPEGTEAMLPKILRETELEEMGKSREEIRQETGERFRTGVYRAPRRVGVAYMLSRQNWVLPSKEKGRMGWYPPHLMFYAPHVNAAQVGASTRPDSLFSVLGGGTPHAFMVVTPPDEMPRAPAPPEDSKTDLPPLMPRDEEIALAKSAGLPEWNEQATIYVLQRGGFVKAVEGANGFSCMVIRENGRGYWEPICYDPEGTETILPRRLREAQLREEGKSADEIRADTARRFASGEYRAPRRTGLAFMLTNKNWGASPRGGLAWFPPHVMVYSQGVRGSEIGAVLSRLPYTGVMLREGDLHGYIVVPLAQKMPMGPVAPLAGDVSPFPRAEGEPHKHN